MAVSLSCAILKSSDGLYNNLLFYVLKIIFTALHLLFQAYFSKKQYALMYNQKSYLRQN